MRRSGQETAGFGVSRAEGCVAVVVFRMTRLI